MDIFHLYDPPYPAKWSDSEATKSNLTLAKPDTAYIIATGLRKKNQIEQHHA